MKKLFITVFLFLSIATFGQNKEIIYLWPGKVPGETKEKHQPVYGLRPGNPAAETWPLLAEKWLISTLKPTK
jgi:hypothetical protein